MLLLWNYLAAVIIIVDSLQTAFGDELLSARCQANCLHQLEIRAKDDAERRRHLKHQIVNLCKDEAQCSSCTAPCRKVFINANSCQETLCQDAADKESCRRSCELLHKIYVEKPGICPQAASLSHSNECAAACHLDGDCPEAQKCCTTGCSRRCYRAETQDPRLLPTPTGISVVERKRKRSAIVRWVMQRMSRQHTTTNANLYILQWRWSVHRDEEKMTEWQTIMVKNKMYAILKHLLSPGRYYQFRVAAVNLYGSHGFSNSSGLFKLSKEARAPGKPTDVASGDANQDADGFWSQKIFWKPPASDLPIKSYVLTWQKSTIEEANAYEDLFRRKAELLQQEKRSALSHDDEEDTEEEEGFAELGRTSTVVPAYSTSADVGPLASGSVFLVEVHANVDSSDGELRGEKAITFVRTPSQSNQDLSSPQSEGSTVSPTDSNKPETLGALDTKSLEIEPPFYKTGVLKTTVSWRKSPQCASQRNPFVVRWHLTACRPFDNHKRTYYDLDTSGEDWADLRVSGCTVTLGDLNFSCFYTVEVKTLDNEQAFARAEFETRSCQETPSDEQVPCESTLLRCTPNENGAECFWSEPPTLAEAQPQLQPIIGYRISLTRLKTSESNETIAPSTTNSIKFGGLSTDTEYGVVVQALTRTGIGATMKTAFQTATPDLRNSLNTQHTSREAYVNVYSNDDETEESKKILDMEAFSIDRIVELPLGRSDAASVRWKNSLFCFIFILWIFRFTSLTYISISF